MYQIIDKAGQTFGPAPIDTLKQWAIERRLTPDMTVVDQSTGQRGLASELLLGMGVFLDPIPPGADPNPAPAVTPPHVEPIVQDPDQAPPAQSIPAVSYVHKGSSKPGHPPTLQARGVAFFIDAIFGLMVYMGLTALIWNIFFVSYETITWGARLKFDYFAIPVTMAFFLLRDAFFPGQSIGKKIANLKIVTTNGKPLTPMHSVLRNIVAVPMLFLPVAGITYVAQALLVLGFFGECFMVLTMGKRFGDGLALTVVVNA